MSARLRVHSYLFLLPLLLLSAACLEEEPTLMALPSGSPEGGGEIWVAAQDASQLKILHGRGSIETVTLPAGAGPHEINFSPSSEYVYVANVGNGTLMVVRADDRQLIATLPLGDSGSGDVGTHQARPSPDGSVLLVSQIQSKTLIKIAADETAESWTVSGSLTLPESPLCTAFRADGQRAYVALGPRGVAVVDVPSMSLVTSVGDGGVLPTAGSVQCGLVESQDGRTLFVDSRGEGADVGHFYLLDTRTDTLTLLTAFPAQDLHGFDVSPNEKRAFAAERGGDALKVIDLTTPGAPAATIALDARPFEADWPDKVAARGIYIYVTLRTAGQVARVHGNTGKVTFIELIAPSANALHGIVVRP